VTTLQDVVDIGRHDRLLAVVSTFGADPTIQRSVVNADVLPIPIGGAEVVGFVTAGKAKLTNLRNRPQVSITFRSGWQWSTAEGRAKLIGPDDAYPEIDAERLRLLLSEVFTAAGGFHDDWVAYDRIMVEERRDAASVSVLRHYSS
jgi:PPOX class probable F420-dependent enzyme